MHLDKKIWIWISRSSKFLWQILGHKNEKMLLKNNFFWKFNFFLYIFGKVSIQKIGNFFLQFPKIFNKFQAWFSQLEQTNRSGKKSNLQKWHWLECASSNCRQSTARRASAKGPYRRRQHVERSLLIASGTPGKWQNYIYFWKKKLKKMKNKKSVSKN